MNDQLIIKQILNLTRNWTFQDWKRFRSYSDYWKIKNTMHKNWFNPKTNKWNNYAYTNWLRWKLNAIIEDSY